MLSIIVAAAENNVIGINNELPWRMPADMRYFKDKTLGHPIIMGRKSFEALGKPLPNRTNIVITRQADYAPAGVLVVSSLEEAIAKANSLVDEDDDEVFIIGGGEVFREAMSVVDQLFVTRIHTDEVKGDTYFPDINLNDWALISSDPQNSDEKHAYDYTFEVWVRH